MIFFFRLAPSGSRSPPLSSVSALAADLRSASRPFQLRSGKASSLHQGVVPQRRREKNQLLKRNSNLRYNSFFTLNFSFLTLEIFLISHKNFSSSPMYSYFYLSLHIPLFIARATRIYVVAHNLNAFHMISSLSSCRYGFVPIYI